MNFKRFIKHYDKFCVAILALLILALDIFNVTTESILAEATMAVMAILIFFLIKLENKIDKLAQFDKIEGIRSFHLSRDNLSSLEDIFDIVSDEIIFWGSALHSVHDRSDLIVKKLNQGCKVKILMMALKNKNGDLNPLIESFQKITRHVGFHDRLSISHMEFIGIYQSLDSYQRELFEIRFYDYFPTGNFILIDKDSGKGFIRIEPFIFGCNSHESPSFDVDSKTGTKLFRVVNRAFEEVWENSSPYSL